MSTRSITIVKDAEGNSIICMYRQSDGYPDGHGEELARYLASHQIVNGIGYGDTWKNAFNGVQCMAASIVAEFKDTIGGIYLYAPEDGADHGQEWIYVVSVRDSKPYMQVMQDWGGAAWEGYAVDFDAEAVEAVFA